MSFGTLFVNCCCQVKIGLNHYFVLFSIFFCSDDHIFLFTRSHYIPILIVYHLIQFSKEENWFYKRFQLTFQKWRQYYFLLIFQVLLTGATLGPEINSLCRQQGCFHVLFVSGCLDWSGVRFWKIDKIIQVFRGLFLLFTPYLSNQELFDSTETDFKVHWSLSYCNRVNK